MSDPAGNLVDKLDVLKEEKPALYDAKGRPLQRVVGFQAERYSRDEALARESATKLRKHHAHRNVRNAMARTSRRRNRGT